ncbi:MAG TPA: hypothetical protein VF442_01025 [Sphingobium sp.]
MTVYRHRVRTTLANAFVEKEGLSFAPERGKGPLYYWQVTVKTRAGDIPEVRRDYRIMAELDYDAAFEGLRLFGEELDFVEIHV